MFRKIDLHIHSPASDCYTDNMSPESNLHTSPDDIVGAAVAAGLHAIGIADHNSAEWVDRVRDAASGTSLVVFPGIEISAKGGHVLAFFPPQTQSSELRKLVLDLGFTPQQFGLGYLDGTRWMDEIFDIVAEQGGLAISAHVDRRPRGFIAASEIPTEVKRRIYSSPNLQALEITIPQNKPLWNKGQMPGYPQGRACIQGSDGHAPAEVGRRPFYANLPKLDLDSLRLAFREYETRIRFPQEMESECAPQALA
ncbi:MAG: hypothetical protein HY671_02150 [Chloroflexi bacterium]|nr:hypothetical protein [Chloroflexota bacterium]